MSDPVDHLDIIDTDDGGHFYTYNGKRVPNVTEILELTDVLLQNSFYKERKEAAAIRGREVHLATADIDRGGPVWWTDQDEIMPYTLAWKQFKVDYDFQPLFIEQPIYSRAFRYAGTCDRFGSIHLPGGRRAVVLEIKAVATIGEHVALQLAGYNQLYAPDSDKRDLIAVQLKPTGRYVVHNFTERIDHHTMIFLAALSLARWKDRMHHINRWT